MSVKEFKKDEIIFKQGDFSPVMYDILAGQVGIFAAYGTENEKQITVLGEGQLLGEMGLIEAYPRSATAVAMEDGVKLREIGENEFSAYFSEQPERVLLIMRQLSARLRKTTKDYLEVCHAICDVEDLPEDAPMDPELRARLMAIQEEYMMLSMSGLRFY